MELAPRAQKIQSPIFAAPPSKIRQPPSQKILPQGRINIKIYISGGICEFTIYYQCQKRGGEGQQEKNLWGEGCGIFDHLIQKSDIFLLYLHVFFQNIFLHWWWLFKITPPLFFVQFGGKSAPPPRPFFFKNLAPLPPFDILPKIWYFFYNLQWGFWAK